MKKKILFFAALALITWTITSCMDDGDCGFCKNVTYDNGVKTNETGETEYCGENYAAQKTKQDVVIGSLVTTTVCR